MAKLPRFFPTEQYFSVEILDNFYRVEVIENFVIIGLGIVVLVVVFLVAF